MHTVSRPILRRLIQSRRTRTGPIFETRLCAVTQSQLHPAYQCLDFPEISHGWSLVRFQGLSERNPLGRGHRRKSSRSVTIYWLVRLLKSIFWVLNVLSASEKIICGFLGHGADDQELEVD